MASTSGRSSGASASLSASADRKRSNPPEPTMATTARGLGSSGAGPGGRGEGESTRIVRPPAREGQRRRGADAAAPAGGAPSRAWPGSSGRGCRRLRRAGAPTGKPLDHLGQPAMVVARLVGGHDQREAADAEPPQQRRDVRLRRAAVEEDGGAVGVLDQRGVALADVEEADREAVRPGRRRQRGRGHEQGGSHGHADEREPARGREAPPGRRRAVGVRAERTSGAADGLPPRRRSPRTPRRRTGPTRAAAPAGRRASPRSARRASRCMRPAGRVDGARATPRRPRLPGLPRRAGQGPP